MLKSIILRFGVFNEIFAIARVWFHCGRLPVVEYRQCLSEDGPSRVPTLDLPRVSPEAVEHSVDDPPLIGVGESLWLVDAALIQHKFKRKVDVYPLQKQPVDGVSVLEVLQYHMLCEDLVRKIRQVHGDDAALVQLQVIDDDAQEFASRQLLLGLGILHVVWTDADLLLERLKIDAVSLVGHFVHEATNDLHGVKHCLLLDFRISEEQHDQRFLQVVCVRLMLAEELLR